MISTLLAGAGLSTSSGLNAYLPLLILALADRLGSAVDLDRPYSWISSGGGLLVLLLILPLELVGDKIPRLDHYNDLLHSVLRPLAGAFSFAAIVSQHEHLNVWLAAILGLALAAAVHLWKMRARVAITAATKGLGNPIVSMLEDGFSIVLAICSSFAPIANVALIPIALVMLRRTYRRMISGESRTVRMFQPKTRP
ncbi:MAG: DUF4126 domain-containing protein [Chloroflexia bacterium]|nr:DUF4126 domain-containing protein [Chloroflexia bacterium]